jgi:hypothetical protein
MRYCFSHSLEAKRMNLRLFWAVPLLGLNLFAGTIELLPEREAVAPPVPPPTVRKDAASPAEGTLHSTAATINLIGDPTPEEQLYVELINRSRANPAAEAQIFATAIDPDVLQNYDFFDVDLGLMQQQFAALPAVPPVALNARLIDAARRHSGDMLTNSFQGHVGADDSTFVQRVQATGYTFMTLGENVYANADSVFHGHAGFDVDWGPGVGGMQTPPGHRITIHDPSFREVGIGVVFGENTPPTGSTVPGARSVGPQLVTQEFATRQGATPIVTGVVYYDLNGNSFYDLGEGIGGVRVAASGTATQAETARSGGYALPVAGNGTYTVTFSGAGLTSFSREITIAQARNQKVDFLPAYVAPRVTGTTNPAVNRPNSYQITPVPMATAYQWRRYQLITPAVEGAENGTARVAIEQVGEYNVIQGATKKSGSFAFQLAHPRDGIQEQAIVLKPSFVVNANSVLRFASRLGWATAAQRAVVQVSTNSGGSWTEVYGQSGSTVQRPQETAFQDRSINLGAFAGAPILVRFAYIPSGSVYIDTDPDTGWFIDDITLQNAFEIGNEQVNEAVNGAFSFQPAELSNYVLQGRARTGHDFLPWGPELAVQAQEGAANPPELHVAGLRIVNGQVEVDADLVAGSVPATLGLEFKPTLDVAWTTVATSSQNISPTSFRLTTALAGGARTGFYRVKAN